MTTIVGIFLILVSIGVAVFWLATGRRSKPLLKFVCLLTVGIGFLLVIKDQLVEVTLKDWLSIKTSAAAAKADAKTIADIKQQVENQRATIDVVATEALNAKHLSEEASNKIVIAEQKIQDLDNAIQKANEAFTKLDAATDFTLLVAKAQNGDREAYFKIANTPYKSQAEADLQSPIINSIIAKVESETSIKQSYLKVNWANRGLDPQKTTLQQYNEYYSKENYPLGRFFIVQEVFENTHLSELERYEFLAMVIRKDVDLGVLQEACRLMDTKRGSNHNFTKFEGYLNWFEMNRTNFKANL